VVPRRGRLGTVCARGAGLVVLRGPSTSPLDGMETFASALGSLPMTRAGGLFIAVMGVGVALGGAFPRGRKALLAFGAAFAIIALIVVGPHIQVANPSRQQVWFLFGSIALEVVLVRGAFALYKTDGERKLMLAILLAVGVHFVPMAGAFGPLCAALAIVCMGNAAIGLCLSRSAPLNALWTADGIVKILFGAMMLLLR
jgi:hypothetical protein